MDQDQDCDWDGNEMLIGIGDKAGASIRVVIGVRVGIRIKTLDPEGFCIPSFCSQGIRLAPPLPFSCIGGESPTCRGEQPLTLAVAMTR